MIATRPHTGGIIDLNLLPAARRPAEISPSVALGAAALVVAIAGIAPLAMRASAARNDASTVGDRAKVAQQQVAALQVDLNAVRGLRIEIEQTREQQRAVEDELAALRGGARPLGDDLLLLWDAAALHPSVHITSLGTAPAGLSVTGSAPEPLAPIAFARALAGAGFASARMVSFAPAGAGGGEFVIEVVR